MLGTFHPDLGSGYVSRFLFGGFSHTHTLGDLNRNADSDYGC
ncbi:hypothetical protein [Arthrobacter sp. ISL-65]|nr:hypothetical protein [Arthrobacter sp. ISL-65]